jgi:hypothetical protein
MKGNRNLFWFPEPFRRGKYGRSFYLITHKSGMIYAEILDPATGAHITTRSTGTKSREEAAFVVGQ